MVTPEAVFVTLDVAGLGSRMIAAVIDISIQAAVVIGASLIFFQALSAPERGVSSGPLIVYLVVLFVMTWGYYPLFEGLWNGRTPGKRLQRIRVIRADGQPVTMGPVLVRNLVRLVDWLPGSYGVGVVCMVVTRRAQRLGDLAAGTIVIRERLLPSPSPLTLPPHVESAEAGPDTSTVTEREYALIRAFLQRRESLTPESRGRLATELATAFRGRVGAGEAPQEDDERFLEAVALSYRRRFTGPEDRGSSSGVPLPPPP